MNHLLRKYFWAGTLLTIIASAYFVARSATYFADGFILEKLSESSPSGRPGALPSRPRTSTTPLQKKSGRPVIERNIFNSAYEPEGPPPPPSPDTEPALVSDAPADCSNATVDPSGARLNGTVVATPMEFSNITVTEPGSADAVIYWYGDKAFGGEAEVYEVHPKKVFFKRGGQCTYLALGEENSARPVAPARPTTIAPPAIASNAPTIEGITQLSENSYQIDRSLVDEKLANLASLANEAKAIPNMRGGEFNGFKLYAIRSTSLFAQLGLKNGDIIQTVNGEKVDSLDKAMGLLKDLSSASSIQIGLQRRGAPVTIDYSIR